ncbi:hypothetical protein [Kitasatospora sp. GP82]|uniref:hypothetical protein n=1 Tax=Kitasatospora sp. GP82 TaxID=3035089 RepID=UPI002475D573|nr:hypothetical protein [Kitasatospora sp. GP82]MDH6123137.1 hypothetical protein [Kitasatospora sp. GP82]
MTEICRNLHRAAVATVLAATLGLAAAPLAMASDGAATVAAAPETVAASDLAAARSAVQTPSVLDQLGHFFARKGVPPNQPPGITAADEASAAAQAAPQLSGETVPVYTLDAGFVKGMAGAPVAKADFVASKVVAEDGRSASVWTVRAGSGWRVVNIASGSDETDYAARAASGGGGTAFREPQVNAWYVLRGGRVLPLDDEARRSVGTAGVGLAEYRTLVHQRYADKLPGSAYDRAGEGGGYRLGAAPEGKGSAAVPVLAAGGALGVTVLAGAGLAVRRRARA